jgi:hypothetical protein
LAHQYAAGSAIGRRSRTGQSAQDKGPHLARIVADPSQGLCAGSAYSQNGQQKVKGRCLAGANPLGDALGFAFEPGQVESRFTMHFGGDALDLCCPNAAFPEQAGRGAAGSQQAQQDVKGSRSPAVARGQGAGLGQSAGVVRTDT